MIILNNSSVADVKYGSQQVDKVYHGSNLVWQREEWDGDDVYLRVGGKTPEYTGDILLGGSGGLLYDTGSSNPNYDGLTLIDKYGFKISIMGTKAQVHSNYSLLNLFDGENSGGSYAYAYVSNGNSSSRQINFKVDMPFNQWQLTRIGYWEGTFSDSTDFVNEIYVVPPNRANNDNVTVPRVTATNNAVYSITKTYSFENGDPTKNRFVIKLASVGEKMWHFYTEIFFELRIPYAEYKAWKRECHVPVKIAEKTINNRTIGSIVMK